MNIEDSAIARALDIAEQFAPDQSQTDDARKEHLALFAVAVAAERHQASKPGREMANWAELQKALAGLKALVGEDFGTLGQRAPSAEPDRRPAGALKHDPAPRTWRTEFGEAYAVPEAELVAAGFRDESWHNDTSPSFAMDLKDGRRRKVVIWCGHPDPAKREDCGGTRFGVVVECDGEVEDVPCQTDDITVAIAAAKKEAGL